MKYLDSLNPQQKEAVLCTEGPLLILAGAGSGKTYTMASRIAYLLQAKRVKPYEIVGLSFTRRAAHELKERVQKMVASAGYRESLKGLNISTFHGLCVKILRKFHREFELSPHFTICSQSDQESLFEEIYKELKLDEKKIQTDWLLSEISQFKNSGRSDAAAEEYFLNRQNLPEEYRIYLVHAFRSYQKKLQAQESLDFDDLIRVTSLSLKAHPEVCQRIKNQVRYLMIDEYQDTNGAQFELIQQLLNTAQNICVVGDDDQSIYAWRGANSDHILSFAQYFKAAKTICLDQNYRSTQHILSAANSVIMNNKHRFKKTLWSALGDGQKLKSVLVDEDRSEGDFVANEIFYLLNSGENKQKRQPKDIAILFRSAPQSRIFEEYLRQKKISYQLVGATSFFDRKEIKDALALLKLLISERDDTAFKRVLLFPLKGIGRTTLSKCIDGARAANLSLAAYLRATPADLKLTAPVTQTLAHYFSLRDQTLLQLGHLSARDSGAISALAQSYFEAFAFFKRLQDDEADDPLRAARKVEMVEELLHALGQFRPSNEAEDALTEKPVTDARALVSAFIQSFQLDPEPEEKTDPDKNQVTLLTLHGAKGLEWPVVFMVGTEEGLLPHRRSLEGNHDLSEERRLCYVGITRAKELIYCTRAHQRLRYGKTIPREESRFLKEIPAELKEPLDVRANAAPIFSAEKHETEVKDFFSTLRKSLGTGP